MKIPLHIAEKLLRLCSGESLPASSLRHRFVEELIREGLLERKGRVRKTVEVFNVNALQTYLQNRCGINDLAVYVEAGVKEDVLRSELVVASSDSKSRQVRTFKGFLVNCYSPVEARLNEKPIVIQPPEGTFQFIYDFERFAIPGNVTVIGMENAENFRFVAEQKYLFEHLRPLFVSRYPQNQSRDLRKWLQGIPNRFIYFGDFDFAGIGIYLNEYKKYLMERASFFVPENIEELVRKHGSRERYDVQKKNFGEPEEEEIIRLMDVIHRYKKGLDQEVLINKNIMN